jgi:hypothetical protein
VHPRIRLLMCTVLTGALFTACATLQAPAQGQPPPDASTGSVLPVDVARDNFHETSELVKQVIIQVDNCTTNQNLIPCYQAARRLIEITGRVRAALAIAGNPKTNISATLEKNLDRIGDSAVEVITRCTPETFSQKPCQDPLNLLKYDAGGLLYSTTSALALDH